MLIRWENVLVSSGAVMGREIHADLSLQRVFTVQFSTRRRMVS